MVNINILLISPYFHPDIGGAENYVYNISKRLVKKGHNITVLCSGMENDKKEIIDGINVIRLKSDFKISRTPIRVGLIYTMSKIISNNEFDVMIINLSVPYFPEIAAILSKIYNIPSVLMYHNDIIKDKGVLKVLTDIYNISLIKLLLNSVNLIITTSPFCYNESVILKPYKDKLEWIPPGVNIEQYGSVKLFKIHDRYGMPEFSKIVLFVGVMSKAHAHKGVDQLIKSFKMVLEEVKDSYLVLVGGGDMLHEYKKLCKELNIENKVIFTGFVDDEEIIEYYKSSDIVVLPSTTIQEGFGMALIEGNACGKPVIGTKIGGIQYVIEEGKNGLLVPPKDPQLLANSIIKLLNDEKLAEKMGENGRKLVENNYNWDHLAEITEIVYKEII